MLDGEERLAIMAVPAFGSDLPRSVAAGEARATPGGDVAVIIPTLNEAAHIADLLGAIGTQARDRVAEILVADGGSTDGTVEIVRGWPDPRVRLIENRARLQSAGVNLAAREAGAAVTTIIRVDAHARYPADFLEQLLAAQAETGAQSVVNRLHSVGVTPFQRAVAIASNSPFGTGGAAHRSGAASGYIDHGHHALFDRATYLELGGYDENFIANEDAEYDVRLRAKGGKIWFTDKANVDYFPRSSPRALARQYFRYGQGRAKTRAKHGERLRLRQLVPPVLALSLLAGLIAGLLFPPALIVIALYLAGVADAAALLTAKSRDVAAALAVIVLPIMHTAWGTGFVVQSARAASART